MNKITTIRMETRSEKKATQTVSKKLFRMSLAIFVLSFMLQLCISNRFAAKNGDLQASLNEKAQLEKDISQLEYENSLLSSLDRIEVEASQLGYVNMTSKLRVIGPLMFASLTKTN